MLSQNVKLYMVMPATTQSMKKEIYVKNQRVSYELEYKRVKNINLRIRADGSMYVSASRNVPQAVIDAFLVAKADFILRALQRCKTKPAGPPCALFTEAELRAVILALCENAYPHFEKRGIKPPEIKFRRMISRWGSCHPAKGILTFSTNLMYAPRECIEYVVWHEFTHFLEANHSAAFYAELEAVCPDWKLCRKKLKEISLR